jgi:trehalose/maltose hydrolase-like predicted phosphorylase
VYTERWALPAQCGAGAVLESRRYAHRLHRSLLVWELRALNATAACTVAWQGCTKAPSGMLQRAPGLYEVVDPEQPADLSMPRRAPAVVAMASSAPSGLSAAAGAVGAKAAPPAAWNVTVGPSSAPLLFLAVVRTTLEDEVTNATAMKLATAELEQHKSSGAAALDASHRQAWADAYGLLPTEGGGGGGGIELEGNPQFAAQVNSSLYYLLCSVREDWPKGVSEGGIASEAYRGMMFWSDGVMDGPLFAAINAPIADALLQYRSERLGAAQAIARMNGYDGAYWPWQSGVTGFERSCGNVSSTSARLPNAMRALAAHAPAASVASVASILCVHRAEMSLALTAVAAVAMKTKMNSKGPRVGCYWMHEVHISADVALYFRLNYYRTGRNKTFLKDVAWPIVSSTADFFASRANRSSDPSGNWTVLQVIGPDEHSYIQDSNTYTNVAAGCVMAFAAEAASLLGLTPPSLATWIAKAASMYVPVQQFCLPWPNASTAGCPPSELVDIHPQYLGYHGQDINQADVALLQWPLHMPMDPAIAKNDLRYYAARSSGSDTKGFYTGDSSYAVAMLFAGERQAAEAQLAFAFDHQLGPFHIWTETNPKVAAHNGTGNLNFLTGAGGFLENIVFGYGGLHYSADGLEMTASLPPMNVTSLTLRGIAFAGGSVRLVVNATHQTLSRMSGCGLRLQSTGAGGQHAQHAQHAQRAQRTQQGQQLASWPSVTVLPVGKVVLSIQ